MDEFEKLLTEVSSGVERFVRYRLPSQTDADDVLQEVYLSAYRKFPQLKNKDAFKPWIGLGIKISRSSTCISGKNFPRPRSQSYWIFLWEQ